MKKALLLFVLHATLFTARAQMHEITGISAYSATPGSVVGILGNWFNSTPANNIVWFQSVRATVLTASFGLLEVRVPYGATAGPVSVTIGGLTVHSSFDFTPTFNGASTSPNFLSSTSSSFFTFTTPYALFSRPIDLDLDGKPDLVGSYVTASAGPSAFDSAVMIFKNNITPGGSISAASLPLVKLLYGVRTSLRFKFADMDGDGKVDILFWATSGDTVYMYRNTSVPGTINFGPIIKIRCPNNNAHFDIADMDLDGKPDIIYSKQYYYSTYFGCANIYIAKNNYSSGTISASSFNTGIFIATTPLVLSSNTFDIMVRDLNRDMKPEIICYQNRTSAVMTNDSIFIYRNGVPAPGPIDSSMFSGPLILRTYCNFLRSSCYDLDQDGRPELIFNNGDMGTNPLRLSVFKNLSVYAGPINSSTFAPKVVYDYTTSTSCYAWMESLSCVDITGDQKPEIAFSPYALSFINKSNGSLFDTSTFSQRICGLPGSVGQITQFCDLDSDARADGFGRGGPASSLIVVKNIRENRIPSTHPSNFNIVAATSTSVRLAWAAGDGMGRMVLARAGSAIPVVDTPTSYLTGTYNANSVMSLGSQVGGSGTRVVYLGAGDTVLVTGLTPSTTYHFAVFEYNGNATQLAYLTTGAPAISTTTLPVKLVSFIGERKENDVKLKWTTANELNNDHFEIERSEQGGAWQELGNKKGMGTTYSLTRYEYVDEDAFYNTNSNELQYRLKQVDRDGAFEYSHVVSVRKDGKLLSKLEIIPNPNEGIFTVSTEDAVGQLLNVTNVLGQTVFERVIENAREDVDVRHLGKGVFFMRVGACVRQKMIIQ